MSSAIPGMEFTKMATPRPIARRDGSTVTTWAALPATVIAPKTMNVTHATHVRAFPNKTMSMAAMVATSMMKGNTTAWSGDIPPTAIAVS